jgi:hypothetical protein
MVPMTLRLRLRTFEFNDLLITTRLLGCVAFPLAHHRRTIYATPAVLRRLLISGRRYFSCKLLFFERKAIGGRLSAIAVLDAKLPTDKCAEGNFARARRPYFGLQQADDYVLPRL